MDLLRSGEGAPRKAKNGEGPACGFRMRDEGHRERTETVPAMEGSPVRLRHRGRDREKVVTLESRPRDSALVG